MIRPLAALPFLALPAAAQDWTGQITPYVWAAGVKGHLAPFTGAPQLSFDQSFSEVMKDLDGAVFLSGYAWRGRLVVLGDFSWSSSSRDGLLPAGLPAEGKLTQRSVTLAGGYRALQRDDLTLDLLGGVRGWTLRSRVSVAGGLASASPSDRFLDPIVAIRANLALSPRWSAILYLDTGGFGVGSAHTSQIVATANYQVNDNLFLSAGYRQLTIDYRNGGTHVDATMAGPLFGATWRF